MQAQAFVRKWGPGGPAHVLNERASAYGWTDWTSAMSDDEILRRLLALNRERSVCSTEVLQ